MKKLTELKKFSGTALLRLDWNTEDEWRMEASLPTLKFLLFKGSKIVVLSHKGRPRGFNSELSLKKDALRLAKFLKRKVIFAPGFDFDRIKKDIHQARPGSVFVLENLRFLSGEENNDRGLARKLASLGDIYINDAFAVSHRKNASVVAIAELLPSYAGLNLQAEIENLSRVMRRPAKPLMLVLGGGKAADKLGVIDFFKNKADVILVGGAAANTLLALRGMDTKSSMRETNKNDLQRIKKLLKLKNLVLPHDFVWHKNAILDIGPGSARIFVKKISSAKTLIWSGPLGLFEKHPFEKGNLAVARAIAKNKKCFSVVGGGETVMFLKKYSLDKEFSFVSTGGGAMLEFLAGKELPGITALK